MRYATWNVRNLYRSGSLTAAARELARRWIFRKWDVVAWTGSRWLRIVIGCDGSTGSGMWGYGLDRDGSG